MVGAPALGCFHHQGSLEPQTQIEQVVMHRSHRQQGRNSDGGGIDAAALAIEAKPIGEHQDLGTGAHGCFSLRAQALHSGLQGRRPGLQPKQGGEGLAGQALITHSLEVRLIENRAIEVHHRRAGGFWPQG